jgi:hypothetical protein
MNASCGMLTLPYSRIRFFPSFCLSSSFFFREILPPSHFAVTSFLIAAASGLLDAPHQA